MVHRNSDLPENPVRWESLFPAFRQGEESAEKLNSLFSHIAAKWQSQGLNPGETDSTGQVTRMSWRKELPERCEERHGCKSLGEAHSEH